MTTTQPPRPQGTFLILTALWLLVFAASSQVIIMAPILPRIGEALEVSEKITSWLISAYGFMLFIFALLTGPISDKIGRRKVLLYGTASMALALGAHYFVTDIYSLFLVRAISGAAAGVLSGASVAYIGDLFPYEHRGWASGIVMSGISGGQILGIPMGIYLANTFDYKMPFLSFSVAMFFAFFLVWYAVKQPPVKRNKAPITVKSVFTNYANLLKMPQPRLAVFVYLLIFISVALYLVLLPSWLESARGIGGPGNHQMEMMFLWGGVASILVGPQAGKLSDIFGRRPLIMVSCIGLMFSIGSTYYWTFNYIGASIGFFTIMIFIAMRISPIQALLTAIVPDEQRGILMSLAIAIGQLGFAISSGFAGIIYESFGFEYLIAGSVTSIGLMAILVWMYLEEPERQSSKEA